MKEKDCEKCDGHGWVHGDAGGGNVRKVECEVCDGRGRVPADEAAEEGGAKMRPITQVVRALLAVLLCLGFLVMVAFLVVVDIVDHVSRNQERSQTTDAVVQDLPSPKVSDHD
jgi:hypothetical protein